jgi:UDP-glucose 4-epimerase
MKNILITGASGFIGSFIVEEALRQGFAVWAGIRKRSSRKYLSDERIHFFEMDFNRREELRDRLRAYKEQQGAFDYVIHCAGVTKCLDKQDFERVNYGQTRTLIELLHETEMIPRQFIFISTLSVFGAIHEKDYQPIRENDMPRPNTLYGQSKLKTEQYICSLPDFPYLIFRPTGVYGPRERDYFLMAESIRKHFDFSVGYKRQDLTFVYVKDLVSALFLGIEKGVTRRSYFLTDGECYTSRAFSDLIRKELAISFLVRIKCPLFILKIISLLAEFTGSCLKKSSTLNSDKYNIMKQRNWQCDIHPTVVELDYKPAYRLEEGVKETIAWYKKEGWL